MAVYNRKLIRLDGTVIDHNQDKATFKEVCIRNKHQLRYTNLSHARLEDIDLSFANLQGANLQCTRLVNTNLENVDFLRAYLMNANLTTASLRNADLRYSYILNATFRDACLQNTNLPPYQICPEIGSFIAYKAAKDYIITLKITKDAKRITALGSRKCRTNKAKVLDIRHMDTHHQQDWISSNHSAKFTYYRNEMAFIPIETFNDDIRIECSKGIHFFMTRQEAIEWAKEWQ